MNTQQSSNPSSFESSSKQDIDLLIEKNFQKLGLTGAPSDKKVSIPSGIEENVAQKLWEARENEKIFEHQKDISSLWSELKRCYSAEWLDSLRGWEADKWDKFNADLNAKISQLQGKLSVLSVMETEEHKKWHETHRLADEEWKQSQIFLYYNFFNLNRILQNIQSSLLKLSADIRGSTEQSWAEIKLKGIDSLNKSFNEFDYEWNKLVLMTPQKLSEHKKSTKENISSFLAEYSKWVSNTLSHDWEILKDSSSENWEEAKLKFNTTMKNMQQRLAQLRHQTATKYQEKWDAASGMTEEEWNKLKAETAQAYDHAATNLENIGQAWNHKWEQMKKASKDEWDTVSAATTQKLHQVGTTFSDMWHNFTNWSTKTWYNWTSHPSNTSMALIPIDTNNNAVVPSQTTSTVKFDVDEAFQTTMPISSSSSSSESERKISHSLSGWGNLHGQPSMHKEEFPLSNTGGLFPSFDSAGHVGFTDNFGEEPSFPEQGSLSDKPQVAADLEKFNLESSQ